MPTAPLNIDQHDFLAMAREALTIEAQAVFSLAERLNNQFSEAVTAILNCKGRVILVGVGKSGLVAKKIAATFASMLISCPLSTACCVSAAATMIWAPESTAAWAL